jgi:hypothetical protein
MHVEFPQPSCHSTRWRWVFCAFASFDTSVICVVVSFALFVSFSLLLASVLWALGLVGVVVGLPRHRPAIVGLSRPPWPSFRRRWAAGSMSNCRGGAWLGSHVVAVCGCRFVLAGRHVSDVGFKRVSGGKWKEGGKTRATTNDVARVLTYHAAPPMSPSILLPAYPSIDEHEDQPTSLRRGEGHGRLRVCVGRQLGGEDGGRVRMVVVVREWWW